MRATPTGRLIFWYYAATAGFILLDYGASVNVRVAFLDGLPGWRIAYYGFCAVCFLAIQRWPRWSGTIAAGESLINLSALLISTGMRVSFPLTSRMAKAVLCPRAIWGISC